jgi:hypothetical protein
VSWGVAIVLSLVAILGLTLVMGTGDVEEDVVEVTPLSPLTTPVPSATATSGWWGDVEAELSILATPTLTATATVEP